MTNTCHRKEHNYTAAVTYPKKGQSEYFTRYLKLKAETQEMRKPGSISPSKEHSNSSPTKDNTQKNHRTNKMNSEYLS